MESIFFNEDIISIFNKSFDSFIVNKELINKYSWKNFKKYFSQLYNFLENFQNNNDNNSEFIKTYFFTKLFYIFYSNFLEYIEHYDCLNADIDTFHDKFKNNSEIIKKLYISSKSKKILNILNPFFIKKININEDIDKINNTIKHYDKLFTLTNNNHKKILNIIIFNNIFSKNLSYKNYHDFYIKNIINKEHYFNNNFSDFNEFIQNIPNLKNITLSNTKNNNNSSPNINYNINNIINYILEFFPNLKLFKDNHSFIIKSKKNPGKIIIEQSNEDVNEIIFYQYNLSLFHLNNEEISDLNFLKKTNNLIKIKYENKNFNDPRGVLNIFSCIVRACKYLEYCCIGISDIINYSTQFNYFYETFVYFLSFIKKDICVGNLKKFIIDIIVFFYIYAYYDYYFYYNNKLLDTINSNSDNKNEIFIDFCMSIKKLFKLPNNLEIYPPFSKINSVIDNILLYSFNYPNYLKFYDLIYAISTVFEFEETDPLLIIQKLISYSDSSNSLSNDQTYSFEDDNHNNVNDKNYNKNNLDDKNNNKDKNSYKNYKEDKNKFAELTIENSENYILDTER